MKNKSEESMIIDIKDEMGNIATNYIPNDIKEIAKSMGITIEQLHEKTKGMYATIQHLRNKHNG